MKKIVFDLDDTLWGLNNLVTSLVGADYNKITTFVITDNENFSEEAKAQFIEKYYDINTWKQMVLYEGANRLRELETDEVRVYINSNCSTTEIMEYKREILPKLLGIPTERIMLQIGVRNKPMLDDMLIFVDDSPNNIKKSTAKYNIVPDKPWNRDFADAIRCKDFRNVIDTIKDILKKEGLAQ